MGYNREMADFDTSALTPGQSRSAPDGERIGCSAGGRLVQLRKRVSEPGFVVTVDAEPRPEVPAELMTHEWGAANSEFARLMREY